MPFLESLDSISERLAHRKSKMAQTVDPEEVLARFEQLSVLEAESEDIELEISRAPS